MGVRRKDRSYFYLLQSTLYTIFGRSREKYQLGLINKIDVVLADTDVFYVLPRW
jgi:hypothetical protein